MRKINWPWAIVISFILFSGFIGYFVVRIQTEAQLSHHLVTQEYYKEELNTEADIKALSNGKQWSNSIKIERLADGIRISALPNKQRIKIEGYRASDVAKDFKFYLHPYSNRYIIKDSLLVPGKWKISLSWTSDTIAYRVVKEFYY